MARNWIVYVRAIKTNRSRIQAASGIPTEVFHEAHRTRGGWNHEEWQKHIFTGTRNGKLKGCKFAGSKYSNTFVLVDGGQNTYNVNRGRAVGTG